MKKIYGMKRFLACEKRSQIHMYVVYIIYITTVLSPKFELGFVEKSSRIDY
jgi:hypothetical protein